MSKDMYTQNLVANLAKYMKQDEANQEVPDSTTRQEASG
jgi:hypothetical protein